MKNHLTPSYGRGADAIAKRLGGETAKQKGSSWLTRCPAHDDKNPSLSIANREDGGLLVHCFAGCLQKDVIAALSDLGISVHAQQFSHTETMCSEAIVREDWTPICPVPDTAPAFSTSNNEPCWTYRTAQGAIAFHVWRDDRADHEKRFYPQTYCRSDRGRYEWRRKALSAPRVPYNLAEIVKRIDDPVLILEGEKAADAAAVLLPSHTATTSSGGANGVAQTDWSHFTDRLVVIWPDNDGPGAAYARSVAKALRAAGAHSIAIVEVPPDFPTKWDLADPLPAGFSDADLERLLLSAVPFQCDVSSPKLIAVAQDRETPIPLFREISDAAPFPSEALGDLEAPARAIAETVQLPIAVAANCVIASVALIAQAHANVELPIGGGTEVPLSVFLISILASGDRKTTADRIAGRAVNEHEDQLRLEHEEAKQNHSVAVSNWKAEHQRITRDKNLTKVQRAAQLEALGREPLEPLLPMLTCPEPTFEGLAKSLMIGQPSQGIFSSEGGQFVGGHGMSDDARLRTAAGLSSLWDQGIIKRVRATDGNTMVAGRRVSMHLMMQPGVSVALLGDDLLLDQGLVSRLLLSAPDSLMGTRYWREVDQVQLDEIEKFQLRVKELFEEPLPLRDNTRNELEPRKLPLSPEARAHWIAYSDRVEARLAANGAFEPIRGLAAKLAEHAARLAGILEIYATPNARCVDERAMTGGTLLAEYYAMEALRLVGVQAVDADLVNAQLLLDWLRNVWPESLIDARTVVRRGPNRLRDTKTVHRLIEILISNYWLIGPRVGEVNGARSRKAYKVVRL